MEIEDVLNNIVLANNEIDSLIVLDPINGLLLYYNTKYSDNPARNGKVLYENRNQIAGALSGVNNITNTLTEFGESSERGELRYAVFQLTLGILVLYFISINNKPFVIGFISGTQDGLGLLLNHSEKNMPTIENKLKDLL